MTPLHSGARLGTYEIVDAIGAGGMGVVYRALDTQLHRTVALKVLIAESSGPGTVTPDLLLEEARAASALNHPNVCTVYEVREETGRAFIVMEYVDGRALHEQIPNDGLPTDTVLRYAAQVVDALVHAHDRGVLHRDLKSGNVIVTREGRAKIVDFGLARRFGVGAPDDATRSKTHVGDSKRVAGTLAYMAPELLQGDPHDVRSDIWSFGVLLYEMATGRLPFTGRTPFDVTAAILRAPLPSFPNHVPASVRTIIARCLIKEPPQRYQTAGEVRAALEAVQSDVSMVPTTPTETISKRRRAHRRVAAGAAAAAIVLGLAAWWKLRGVPGAAETPGRLVQVLASDRQVTEPAISPDGTMVAYVAEDEGGRLDLYVTRVAGGARVRLTNDDGRETHPRFSPDGERIAFARHTQDGSRDICVVPALGGQVSVVVPSGGQPAWSADAQGIVYVRVAEGGKRMFLATARSDGSGVRDLLRGEGTYPFVRAPAWSPDGRLIAFVRGTGGVSGEIWVTDAEGRAPPRRLSADPPAVFSDDPTFSADGRSIVHSSNRGGATNIWALPLDGGPAVRLTTGPGPDESPTVDRQGRVAFLNSRWRNELIIHHIPTGQTRSLVRHTPYLWAPAFSPDGRELAYSRSEVDGSWHVWATGLEGGSPRQLTRSDLGELYPRWTPDSHSVLYQNWGAPRRIWRVSREGGPPVAVTPAGLEASYQDLSPDGRSLAFVSMQDNDERVFVMPVDGSAPPRLLRPRASSLPRWSPDGAWIAFAADRGYFGGLFIVHPDGSGERRVAQVGGWPVWWPDGRRIAFLTVRGDLNQQIETVGLDGSRSEGPLPIRFNGNNYPFDISRDGTLLATSDSVHMSSEIWVAGGAARAAPSRRR